MERMQYIFSGEASTIYDIRLSMHILPLYVIPINLVPTLGTKLYSRESRHFATFFCLAWGSTLTCDVLSTVFFL